MTPEKLKEIEAKAQDFADKYFNYITEGFSESVMNNHKDEIQQNATHRQIGYTAGALSRQPELDTLQSENDRLRERVRELEEAIKSILIFCLDNGAPVDGFMFRDNILAAKSLLTKPDSTGGGEKENSIAVSQNVKQTDVTRNYICAECGTAHSITEVVSDDNGWDYTYSCNKCGDVIESNGKYYGK